MYFCSIVLKRKRKESFTMNMKNVKAQSAKALANVSLKLGKVSADSDMLLYLSPAESSEGLEKT